MKISERKHRLRTRGIVPVPQETEPRKKGSTAPARAGSSKGTPARKGAAPPAKAPRPRWQPSSGTQLAFGLAYMVFAPVLFFQNIVAMHVPHSKYHPGAFELLMPVLFFLFGVWWVYRGLTARRRKNKLAAATATTVTEPAVARTSRRSWLRVRHADGADRRSGQ